MSKEATPGYPAPLTACIVTAITVSRPNRCSNGARASTRPIAEQLGLVTTNPPDFRRQVWHSSSLMCPPLTSGITSGTSACMRQALELDTTAHPDSANRGSGSIAVVPSSAANKILGAPAGFAGDTRMLAMAAGIEVFNRQRAASAYSLPS